MLSDRASGDNHPWFVEKHRPMVALAFSTTALAIAATFACSIEAIRIIGVTILTGVISSTANHMFACRDCPEYFTVTNVDGTQPIYNKESLDHRLIRTLNPTANALFWGPRSSWRMSAIAGCILAIAARLPVFSITVSAATLTPSLIVLAVGAFVAAHSAARKEQEAMEQLITYADKSKGYDSDGFRKGYSAIPKEFQARWKACETRNSTSNTVLKHGFLTIIALIAVSRIGRLPLF